MATKRNSPYVWATWLPKMMLGDCTCQWSLWHMTNYYYDKAPSDTDFTQWRVNHTRLVHELADAEEANGAQLFFEDQVEMRFRRPSGLVIHGKPDIVSVVGNEATVIEAKVGEPRDRDLLQAKIYMYALPRCDSRFTDHRVHGRVVYSNGTRTNIDATTIDEEFEEGLNHWLELIERDHPARRVPSQDNCKFCKVSARDCLDRVAGEVDLADDW